jgi:hypothetical protein|tara:strand:+ start:2320 stop:2988 length:669 start_codon:yes stop_codon:yes gene_type:complete
MSKILGLRQQRVQFFYDTDFRTVGASAGSDLAASEKILFAGATPGDLSRTNMPSPGQLTSDQTFLCFAVRHEIQFFNATLAYLAPGAASGLTALQGSDSLMVWTVNSSTFSFKVSEKIEFEGPVSMTPAGGGVNGQVGVTTAGLAGGGVANLTNGVPASGSIYVLPLPVAITKRQGIQMIEKKFNLNSNAGVTVNIVNEINAYLGGKLFRAYIDGYNTRDVL